MNFASTRAQPTGYNNPLIYSLLQWKKKTEKHRAALKFKAAARIARVTHDLSTSVRSTSGVSETIEEANENME